MTRRYLQDVIESAEVALDDYLWHAAGRSRDDLAGDVLGTGEEAQSAYFAAARRTFLSHSIGDTATRPIVSAEAAVTLPAGDYGRIESFQTNVRLMTLTTPASTRRRIQPGIDFSRHEDSILVEPGVQYRTRLSAAEQQLILLIQSGAAPDEVDLLIEEVRSLIGQRRSAHTTTAHPAQPEPLETGFEPVGNGQRKVYYINGVPYYYDKG